MSEEPDEQAVTPAEGTDEPVKVEDQLPETKTEEEAKPEDAEQETASEDGEESDEKPKKRSGIQRLKARERALLAENAELMQRLESTQPRPGATEQEKPPKEEDFNGDWTKFMAASAAFEARQAVREEFRREADSRQQQAQSSAWRETVASHEERLEEAREAIKDFDKVVGAVNTPISNELGREIITSDKSAQLQYHLAQHPEKLRELNAMTGRELAREIGRLEATLSLPQAKKQTTARPPVPPLKGGGVKTFDPHTTENMDEFASWLRKDLARRSGRQ